MGPTQKHQATTGKYSHVLFICECGVFEKKSIRVIRELERWTVDGEIAIETQVVKLVQLLEECDRLFDEASDWGKSSSLPTWVSATSTAGKRRTKATS